jgi:uncharacterized protein (TIGR02145 family)
MVLCKASLSGLVGVSLCMANITGTVTDTGTTPIAGVVVQLKKGGQSDTTDANGRFTLVIGSTALLPGNSTSLPNGLSARISGNMLTVTTSEQTALEVATFDLGGKSVSTMRRILNAGSHTIELPQRGAGVYLYKVKTGNRELVIKGNAVGGTSYGSPATTQGTSMRGLAKQAEAMAAIIDVIAATKAGLLNYRCGIGNSDTSGIVIKMIANAGDVTDADGNVYQTVRIGNQVWTVENLRVTKYNDGTTAIPKDTSAETWTNATTPKYCYYNNTTNADSIKKYGALYDWYVVSPTNPKKIAPAGWHVPSDSEWTVLADYLIAKGYNWDKTITDNKIAKSLAAKTDWSTYSNTGTIACDLTKNNSSGFSALPGGYRYWNGLFFSQSYYGVWWSATLKDFSWDPNGFAWARYLYYDDDYLIRSTNYKSCGYSVRLVRD